MCTASQRNLYLDLKACFKGEFVKAHGVVPICRDHKLLREGHTAVWAGGGAGIQCVVTECMMMAGSGRTRHVVRSRENNSLLFYGICHSQNLSELRRLTLM